MRYTILNSSLIGRELAIPIYNDSGMIYINKGVTLTERTIKSIERLGLNTVYINDGNENISLQEVLDSNTKLRLSKMLKNELEKVKKNKAIDESIIKYIVTDIMNNVNLSENAFLYNSIAQTDELMKIAIHSIDVTVLCIIVAVNKKYDEKRIVNLSIGALLHDIGRVISADAENGHPSIGYKYIKDHTDFPPTATISILQHHENNDGTGYPSKLSDEKIFEYTKILSICNEYHNAQTKDDILPHQAIERITAQTPGKFNAEIYKDFIGSVYCYPNGLSVKLSNSLSGTIVMQNKNFPSRPVIMIRNANKEQCINLLDNLTLFIDKVIL